MKGDGRMELDMDMRLSLFRDMIGCCHSLYLWTFDCIGGELSGNCPEEELVSGLLVSNRDQAILKEYAGIHQKPVIMTNEIGFQYVAVPEKDGEKLWRFHILGPFFMDDAAVKQVGGRLQKRELTQTRYAQAVHFLRKVPVISLNRVLEYAIMLYFCMTGERITLSDVHCRDSEQDKTGEDRKVETVQIHGTYEAEQEMLRLVREGDLNYKEHMNRMSMTGNMGRMSNEGYEWNMRNAILVCITLFSRAAIEGGLDPEIAMTLTDRYFQSVEACRSMEELKEICDTMQEDFVQRVHRCRQDTRVSQPMRTCADYIGLHLEEELTLQELARLSGYSDYYFSKRFKREMGVTPKEYIRDKRLDRARFLLRTTGLSIQDIGERLHFGSHSYFTEAFRKAEGISPTRYRELAKSGRLLKETAEHSAEKAR